MRRDRKPRPPAISPLEGPVRRSSSVRGAIDQRRKPKRDTDPSFGLHPLPIPFDVFPIIAAPASGTTTLLVGPGAGDSLGPVPVGWRAYLYTVAPYLEGVGGPLQGPRIPGAGVSITWSLQLDGQPVQSYGSIGCLLGAWDSFAPVPLLELREGATLTATVRNVDPGGLYTFLGLRLRGRWVPWAQTEAR